MASNNRAAQINKVLKFAKKHFKPAEIPPNRTVLEHLIFACCAENSLLAPANEVYESLASDYYDWNEVRVTSIRELVDVMKPLNDPKEAATRLKRVLQSVFETHYSFDLEPLKKQNIGATVKQFEKYNGTTSFTVSFVTQNALAGHSIPINRGLLESMRVVGVISDAEAAKGTVPGLERVVPKSKGTEVGTLLHQLGVELFRSPYGPTIRKFLLEIDPTCKERLPKRPSKPSAAKKKADKPGNDKPGAAKSTAEKPAGSTAAKKTKAKAATPQPAKTAAAKTAAAKTAAGKTAAKKAATKKAVAKKTPAKKTAVKKTAAKKTAKKKPAAKGAAKTKKKTAKKTATKAAGKKRPAKKKAATKKAKATKKAQKSKSVTKKLSKRKPK